MDLGRPPLKRHVTVDYSLVVLRTAGLLHPCLTGGATEVGAVAYLLGEAVPKHPAGLAAPLGVCFKVHMFPTVL